LLCLISYLVVVRGPSDPGIFEIGFIGGLFSVLSFLHSIWSIILILKEEHSKQ